MKKRQLVLMVSVAMAMNVASAQENSIPRNNPRLSDFERTLTPQQRQLQQSLKRERDQSLNSSNSVNSNNSAVSPISPSNNASTDSEVNVAPVTQIRVRPIEVNTVDVEKVTDTAVETINNQVESVVTPLNQSATSVEELVSQEPTSIEPVSVGAPNTEIVEALANEAEQVIDSQANEVVVEQSAAIETVENVEASLESVVNEVQADAADVAEASADSATETVREIPEGITVISEDDDFVVDANLLGQDRRNEIRDLEKYQKATRCLTVIGVPGDVRMSPAQVSQQPLDLEADEIELPDDQTVILKGKAVAAQGPQQISAERLRYSKNDNIVKAEDNVDLYSSNGDHLKADQLEIDLDTFIGDVGEVEYQLAERALKPRLNNNVFVSARGAAGDGKFLGHDLMRFNDATYTTCPEGNESVVVKANELELDYSNNIGTARDAVLRFYGVPIFYLPYFTFPISKERKSGLLSVEFGTDRDEGVFFGTPIYWNIHPQVDATITPWYYTDRGFLLEGELRYLTEKSDGILKGAYIPSDDIEGGDRGAITFIHDHEFTDDLDGNVNFQYASDENYFDDFSTGLDLSSSSFLPQRGLLNYYTPDIRATLGVLSYYSINSDISSFNEPYERLPYIEASTTQDLPFGFEAGAEASFDYFRHSDRIDGSRINLSPFIAYPIREVYGSIEPKVEFKYLGYNLNEPVQGSTNDSPDVYTTITTVDSKLIFEREFDWAGDSHIQTLEPRIKYAYIPDEEQSAIPDFDTSERNNNNFGSIFEENRFFGGDRVGDTNQITVGVTSRFINDESGAQRGEFSIGQIYYLEDRQISLDSDNANIDDSESDLLGEARIKLYNDWEVYGFTAYDPDDNETRVRRATLSYSKDGESNSAGNTYMNLGYFFSQPENSTTSSEQLSLQAGYAINDTWALFGRTIYDIEESESRFLNAGVRYDACCWSLSVVGEQSFDNNQSEDTRVFVFFSLTGFTELDYGL